MNNLLQVNIVEYRGIIYKPGMCVVIELNHENNEIKLCEIHSIFITKTYDNVYFIGIENYMIENPQLGLYSVEPGKENINVICEYSGLLDYYPLCKQQIGNEFYIFLKHAFFEEI